MTNLCHVCGGNKFETHSVLWPDLIKEWNLSLHEADYINRQQGHICRSCGSNMRSRALAKAILSSFGSKKIFQEFILSGFDNLKVLEINRAGDLTNYLQQVSGHRLIEYPAFDMMSLDLPSCEYDVIVHSDTLEHISDPLVGLRECSRVLKRTGRLFFTIPMLVDRPTKSRAGLPNSYHGNKATLADDFIVHFEFGYDAWKIPILAGFNKVHLHLLEWPSALAFECSKDG
jgi:SAM-dependent methyltransferase